MSNEYIIVNSKKNTEDVWETISSTYTPSKGEVCIMVPTGNALESMRSKLGDDNLDTLQKFIETENVQVGIKIGDGQTVFKNLPYLTDVSSIRPDWSETDVNSPNYIHHKPVTNDDMFQTGNMKILTFSYEDLNDAYKNGNVQIFHGNEYCLLKDLSNGLYFTHPQDLLIEEDNSWGHYDIIYEDNIKSSQKFFYKDNIIANRELVKTNQDQDLYEIQIRVFIQSLIERIIESNSKVLYAFSTFEEFSNYFEILNEDTALKENCLYYDQNNEILLWYRSGVLEKVNYKILSDNFGEENSEENIYPGFMSSLYTRLFVISNNLSKLIINKNNSVKRNEIYELLISNFNATNNNIINLVDFLANRFYTLIYTPKVYNEIQMGVESSVNSYYEINHEIIIDSNEKLYLRKNRLEYYLNEVEENYNEYKDTIIIPAGQSINEISKPNTEWTYDTDAKIYLTIEKKDENRDFLIVDEKNNNNSNAEEILLTEIIRDDSLDTYQIPVSNMTEINFNEFDASLLLTSKDYELELTQEQELNSFNSSFIINSDFPLNINDYNFKYKYKNIQINKDKKDCFNNKKLLFNLEEDYVQYKWDLVIIITGKNSKQKILKYNNSNYTYSVPSIQDSNGNIIYSIKTEYDVLDDEDFTLDDISIDIKTDFENTFISKQSYTYEELNYDTNINKYQYKINISDNNILKDNKPINFITYTLPERNNQLYYAKEIKEYTPPKPKEEVDEIDFLFYSFKDILSDEDAVLEFKTKKGENDSLFVNLQIIDNAIPENNVKNINIKIIDEFGHININEIINSFKGDLQIKDGFNELLSLSKIKIAEARNNYETELEAQREFWTTFKENIREFFEETIHFQLSVNHNQESLLKEMGLNEFYSLIYYTFMENGELINTANIFSTKYFIDLLCQAIQKICIDQNKETYKDQLFIEYNDYLSFEENVLYKNVDSNTYWMLNKQNSSLEVIPNGSNYYTFKNNNLVLNLSLNIKDQILFRHKLTYVYSNVYNIMDLNNILNFILPTPLSEGTYTICFKYVSNNALKASLRFYYKTRTLKSSFLKGLRPNWDSNDFDSAGYILNRPIGRDSMGRIGLADEEGDFVVDVKDPSYDYYSYFQKLIKKIMGNVLSAETLEQLLENVAKLIFWYNSEDNNGSGHGFDFTKLLYNGTIYDSKEDNKLQSELQQNYPQALANKYEYKNGILHCLKDLIYEIIILKLQMDQVSNIHIGTSAPVGNKYVLWINTSDGRGNGALYYKTTKNNSTVWIPVSALWTDHEGIVYPNNKND